MSDDKYDLQEAEQKHELARRLWLGDFESSLGGLWEQNPALVQVLQSQVDSQYAAADPKRKERLVSGVLMQLVRAQNQFKMPLVTAALSVLTIGHRVPVEFHEGIRRFFFGALATESWTHGPARDGAQPAPSAG